MNNLIGPMVAQAVIDVRNDLKAVQRNPLDRVLKSVGSDLFVTQLVAGYFDIPVDTSVLIATHASNLCNQLKLEVMVGVIQKRLSKPAFKLFISRCKSVYSIRKEVERIIDLPIGLKSSDPYQPVATKKFKADIYQVQKDIEDIVGLIPTIYDRMETNNPGLIAFVEHATKKEKVGHGMMRLEIGSASKNGINKMFDSPQGLDVDHRLELNSASINGVAAEKIRRMQYNLDADIVKAMSTLCEAEVLDGEGNRVSFMSTIMDKMAAKAAIDEIENGVIDWNKRNCTPYYVQWKLDFRCRVYMLSSLSSTGSKPGRAMLRCASPKAIGPQGYDTILGAISGAMGHDKESWRLRINHAKENMDRYIEVGKLVLTDPCKAVNMLIEMKADDKWAALSLCVELLRISQFTGPVAEYESTLIINRDATCSGAQIISMLSRQSELSLECNIIGSDDQEGANDLYKKVALGMVKLASDLLPGLREELAEMPEPVIAEEFKTQRRLAQKIDTYSWFIGDLSEKDHRAMCKKYTMIGICYGGTRYGLTDTVANIIKEKELTRKVDALVYAMALTDLYLELLRVDPTFKPLGDVLNFLSDIGREHRDNDSSVKITMPGFMGYEPQSLSFIYRKTTGGSRHWSVLQGKQVRIFSYGLETESAQKVKFAPDYRKQVSSTAPNCIHYLDSTLLAAVVLKMDGTMNLCHDSIGVAVADIGKMMNAIREAVTEILLDNDVLDTIKGGVTVPASVGQVTDELRQGVMKAQYVYC